MKRTIAFIMFILLGVGLCACGATQAPTEPTKSTEVQNVENLIQSIGEVTLDSEEEIALAEEAYNLLSESERELISENASILVAARETYEALVEEKALAESKQRVDNVVNAIDAIGTVTLETGTTLAEIQEAYEQLTEAEKGNVTNYSKLLDAKKALDAAKIESVIGKKYLCASTEFCNSQYDVFVPEGDYWQKANDSYIVISKDYTKLLYVNGDGVYIADLITTYDGDMWHETVITWQETPEPYGEHILTNTSFIFDLKRKLARLVFSFDGEVGKSHNGEYHLFYEFHSN